MHPPLEIDCQSTQRLLEGGEDLLLVDCREPEEYAIARIEGALLVPMSELAERVAELEPHRARHIIVYCHHGGRSFRVAAWLRRQGFEQAQSMAGGIDLWSQTIDASIPRY